MVAGLRRRVARAGRWLAWALRPPLRTKPSQLRAVLGIKRAGGLDPAWYLRRYPDVARAGIDPALHYVASGAGEGRSPGPSSGDRAARGDAGNARTGCGASAEVAMKRDWDARAQASAMHFVATERFDWSERSFSESGRRSVEETVVGDLDRICAGRDPASMRILELGCGIGRMTEHLAGLFGEVHGVDVSAEMIDRARRRLADIPNVFLRETDGSHLSALDDDSFDFAFSFLVFQHAPTKDVVLASIREVNRTLRPGATFKFQVRGRAEGIPREGAPDTWVGVSFGGDELRQIAGRTGFAVRATEGEGGQYLWSWWERER